MTTDLIGIIQRAMEQVETYKHPELDEFRDALQPIVTAAGIAGRLDDHITNITYEGMGVTEKLRIDTEYSVRGCHQMDEIFIPMEILRAQTPLMYAQQWKLEQTFKQADQKLKEAHAQLSVITKKYEEALQAKQAFYVEHGTIK